MAGSRQGVRSSRTGPIRRQLRKLDARISRLDYGIRINRVIRPRLAEEQIELRLNLDMRRKDLRKKIKTYVQPNPMP